MTKKTFNQVAAQGEIHISRIKEIPSDADPVEAKNGMFIIGHSETGHHHVLERENVKVFKKKDTSAGMDILYAIVDAPKELVHQRPWDTHEPIGLLPGMYSFTPGREFDHYAELARKQAD